MCNVVLIWIVNGVVGIDFDVLLIFDVVIYVVFLEVCYVKIFD